MVTVDARGVIFCRNHTIVNDVRANAARHPRHLGALARSIIVVLALALAVHTLCLRFCDSNYFALYEVPVTRGLQQ